MPDNVLGGQGATLLTAIVIVALAMLALAGVFWLIRNRTASTFIRGGKNRLPRLAVLDATAVDTRRRLVLIRRDDVEHLVMIGGPTDIVIESRISGHGDAGTTQPMPLQPVPQPAAGNRPAAPQQARAPQPPRPAAAAATVAATTAAAGIMHSEAAEALDSARTRVFDEPVKAPQPPAPPRAPLPQPPATQASTAAPPATQASAVPADDDRSKAADALESARTRVFEEPSFDESAFDELTADTAPASQTGRSAMVAAPSPAPTPAKTTAAGSDFESVLAAELSEDLSLDIEDDSFFTEPYTEHQLDASEAEMLEAPEVKAEQKRSRDSLEAEMERLLGDLSRKS